MANKIIFGRNGLKVPTPLLIKAIMKWVKRVCLALSISSTISTHEFWAMALVCIAWFVDEIEPLFGEVLPGKNAKIIELENNPPTI